MCTMYPIPTEVRRRHQVQELELWVFVSHHACAENQILVSARSASAYLTPLSHLLALVGRILNYLRSLPLFPLASTHTVSGSLLR